MSETFGVLTDAKTKDNKIFVQETSRPLGTQIYFSSEGDNPADPSAVGGGEELSLTHQVGDPTSQNKIISYNVKENDTYMHEGYVIWQGAAFDKVTLSIIPHVTPTSAGTGTFFNAYGPYIVPAAGDGTLVVQPQDMQLIEMLVGIDYSDKKPGFWNADYNSSTHQFENITAAPTGAGSYNMFNAEVVLDRFVNKILLLDSGFLMLQSAESSQLPCNTDLKLTLDTAGADHTWKAAFIVVMHRNRTV
jgi:hypothetical protein